jgi:hypothetical protein
MARCGCGKGNIRSLCPRVPVTEIDAAARPMPRPCLICLEDNADCFLRCCLQGCVATFHLQCAEQALALQRRCPQCRRPIPDVPADAVLQAADALVELRAFSVQRYADLESTLRNVLAFLGHAAAEEVRRRTTPLSLWWWRQRCARRGRRPSSWEAAPQAPAEVACAQ